MKADLSVGVVSKRCRHFACQLSVKQMFSKLGVREGGGEEACGPHLVLATISTTGRCKMGFPISD